MLVSLLLSSYRCIVTINVLWLFLTVPWVGLQCVIVVFPGHTHLLFGRPYISKSQGHCSSGSEDSLKGFYHIWACQPSEQFN